MKVTFGQVFALKNAINNLKDEKLPFVVSLFIAKNMEWVEKEYNFFHDIEQEFAQKYLQFNADGTPVEKNGGYAIIEGLEEECLQARKDIDEFLVDVNPYKIPIELLESANLSPRDVNALLIILKEDGTNGS